MGLSLPDLGRRMNELKTKDRLGALQAHQDREESAAPFPLANALPKLGGPFPAA